MLSSLIIIHLIIYTTIPDLCITSTPPVQCMYLTTNVQGKLGQQGQGTNVNSTVEGESQQHTH